MDAVTLLAEARSAGLCLELRGNIIRVRGPRRAAPIVERLRQRRDAIFDLLRQPRDLTFGDAINHLRGDLPLACYRCFGRAFRRLAGGPWVCDRCHPAPVPADPAWERVTALPDPARGAPL